jgi:hypothetical protein
MTDDEKLLDELWAYTKALETAFSVWHSSRPSLAPWPVCAPDLGVRLAKRLPASTHNGGSQQ